jgi:hypothetical protein
MAKSHAVRGLEQHQVAWLEFGVQQFVGLFRCFREKAFIAPGALLHR